MMDKEQSPPPYLGPPMVQTNIPYQMQQGSYQTQPGPGVVYNQQPVILSTITQESQSNAPSQVTVVVTQPQLTEVSGEMKCLHCQQQIVTETKYIIGMTAWFCCFTLGAFLLWPFCVIPLFLKACKDVEHRCPNCKKVIHIYRRK